MQTKTISAHLTDQEFFGLALPPAGEPEALPRHLSECLTCSRALQEWKSAVRQLAEEETAVLDRRAAPQWEALENKTMEALGRAGHLRRGAPWKWAASIAAALLLGVLLLPAWRAGRGPARIAGTRGDVVAQDERDDALLREVARLTRGEDNGSWNTLAPEPGLAAGAEKEKL